MRTMGNGGECDISMLTSYLVDQIEPIGPVGPGVQAQQQLLLEIVEEKLAESRRAPNVERDAIASLVGLRVQLRRALGLRDSLAPARQGQPPRRLQPPIRRAAG